MAFTSHAGIRRENTGFVPTVPWVCVRVYRLALHNPRGDMGWEQIPMPTFQPHHFTLAWSPLALALSGVPGEETYRTDAHTLNQSL